MRFGIEGNRALGARDLLCVALRSSTVRLLSRTDWHLHPVVSTGLVVVVWAPDTWASHGRVGSIGGTRGTTEGVFVSA
jgi:hypothetical protein